jgi:hypothetical protein
MLKKTLLSLSILAAAAAQAQLAPAPNTTAPSSPAKKELVARIVRSTQGAIEGMARGLAERPALEIMNGAMQVIATRVPKDKQEQAAKDVQAEAQKYADEAVPIVQKRAVAIAPSAMGAVLEAKFSEDELKQVAAALENPAVIKYQQSLPELQQALGEKLIADTRPQIEPKVKALDEAVGKRLGLPAQGAAVPSEPGAAPRKAPAKKQ